MPKKATAALPWEERHFKQDGFTVAWAIDREQGRVELRLRLGGRRPKELVLDGRTEPRPFTLEESEAPRARRMEVDLRLKDTEAGRKALVARLRFGSGRIYTGTLAEWEPVAPGSKGAPSQEAPSREAPSKDIPSEGTPSSQEDWF